MTIRYYSSTAQDTVLSSSVTAGATSITVSATTGWPTTYPFTLALDYGSGLEELVDVTAVSSLTATVVRGVDSTTAVAHGVGATVRHVISARDIRESNSHVNATSAAHAITAISGLGTNVATFLATPTSANLASTVTDETGSGSLVFGTAPTIAIGINAQTGTTYTPVLADAAKLVTLNNSGAITLTVPAGVFSAGQIINIQQIGAGQVTVQGDGTSTVTGTGTKLRVQYSAASIVCTATNTFQLIGDLA